MHKLIRYTFNRCIALYGRISGFISTNIATKNYFMLGLLIGIPIFVVGFLAIKTLHLEYQGLANAREKTSLYFLQKVNDDIQQSINASITTSITKISTALNNNPIEFPRRMVLSGDIGFIVAYKDEQRIFPPEDATHIMVPENAMMSLLNGLLFTALPQIKNGGKFQTLTSVTPDSSLQSIFHCEALKSGYDVCLLSKKDELTKQFKRVLAQYNLSYPQWNLTLIGPDGKSISQSTQDHADDDYSRALNFPLQEWQLKGQLMDDSDSASRWSFILFIVIVSLLLSWVSFVLFFYRQQQTTLKKNIKRSELAAKLSHELHTPLANLALYADLLKRRASNVNDVLKYADIIQSETDRLSRVSSIAIAVAQGEEENIKQDPGYPDVLIETLLSRFTALLNKRHCKVLFTGNVPQAILFDRTALESIVLQLLDNACKYGGEGEIYLTTTLHKDTLLITIRDYGPGIPDNEQALIFEANYRGKHLDQKGFGLGLAAVRHLARLHGGDIHVENAKPGAKFVVSLKVRPA